MPAMSVGGLASGLDTNSIIAQLTALEQAKVQREIQKKENAQSTLDKFKDIETRLGNLQQKAQALELPKDFNVFKATSNYDDYAVISGGEGATAGQYELKVYELATTQKVASDSFAAVNTPIGGTGGTITLSTSAAAQKTDSTKKTVDVKIEASDSLKDIVNKINAAEGSGVKASIMTMANGDNRLVLTAVDTGTKGFFISEDGATDVLTTLGIVSGYDEQKAVSGNALLTSTGAATSATTFDELNIAFNKITEDDKVGIYLPTNDGGGSDGWITFDLTYKAGDGDYGEIEAGAVGEFKSVGYILAEINASLEAAGASITAELNSSGEIVLSGNLSADQNFDATSLGDVKIQIGEFTGDNGTPVDDAKLDLGTLAQQNIFKNVITEAHNAFYTVDGIAIGSQSNSDDKTIAGTTFTLKKADPAITIKVSLELDTSAIANKIGEFVEELNALLKFIDENSKASVKEETDPNTGKKNSTRTVGAFTGDSGISGLRDNLKQMLSGIINEISGVSSNGYSTVYSSASRLGIVTNRDGYFDLDKEKLNKALAADFEGIRRLFTANSFSDTAGYSVGRFNKDSQSGTYEIKNGTEVWLNGKQLEVTSVGGNILTTKDGLSFEIPISGMGDAKVTFVRGIASQISNFVEKAKSGYYSENTGRFVEGFFKQSKDTYQKRIDEIQKRVDQLQVRVDNYNTRLINQFNALERSMSNLQSQSSNMLSALSMISYKK